MAWDLLSLNDTVGPIFATEGNFYDVWNETESMGVVQVQEGIRNISTLLGSGITRKTNLDNIVEGYVKENQPEGVPQIHREFWGMTRTIFKDGNTRIELHGEDIAEGEHTLLA
jgi:hypothetical protein